MAREAGSRTTRESRKSATDVALHSFTANALKMQDVGPAFDSLLLQKMKLCQQEALEALRDLALMPITANSSNNMVKFMAASRLAGKAGPEAPPDGAVNTADYLKQLNEEFSRSAPRIKEVRERVYVLEDQPLRPPLTGEVQRPTSTEP